MSRLHPVLVALVCVLCLGADCRKREDACIDWSGRTLELTATDWAECSTFNSSACTGFTLPDRVVLRILDEPVRLRDFECQMSRAELVEGDFPDFEFLGPADATLVVSGDFAFAESVRIRGTECYGRFYVGAARIGETERGNPDYWVLPREGGGTWAIGYRFLPNETEACAEIPDCSNECFAEVRSVE